LQGLAEGKAMKLLVNTCTIGVPFVNEIEQAMAAQCRLGEIASRLVLQGGPRDAPIPVIGQTFLGRLLTTPPDHEQAVQVIPEAEVHGRPSSAAWRLSRPPLGKYHDSDVGSSVRCLFLSP
jgi:hypothetical protein